MCKEKKGLTAAISLCLIIVWFYYNIFRLVQPYNRMPYPAMKTSKGLLRTAVPDITSTETPHINDEFLIETPGCTIPNYSKILKYSEASNKHRTCQERLVFVQRLADAEVVFHIDYEKAIKQRGQNFSCAYRFALRSKVPGKQDNYITYTKFRHFQNGSIVKLEEEVITVSCDLFSPNSKKISTYEDSYLILKRKTTDQLKMYYRQKVTDYNVLIIGMDTMSRGRAYHSLPKTITYLNQNGWLDYRGYQKIADNTFPNIMAVLTGNNASSSYSTCAKGMDFCKHLLIWNKYKEVGYITAFGEDNLALPDTFKPYKGFSTPPTDHYARPFFLTGERLVGNLICAKNQPSAHQLLNYALQFTQAYKGDRFFGFFWTNSFSHNLENLPTLFENALINFFDELKQNAVLENSFIFFLSDHGIRFGPIRKARESYYEERLPMMFMWIPYKFREDHPDLYENLKLNQYRLTTPYDFHATLLNIIVRTDSDNISSPEGCKKCRSLTEEVSPQRACSDAGVDKKWCSCHTMYHTSDNDTAIERSLEIAVKYVRDKVRSIQTVNCTTCSWLTFKRVIRSDWYKSGDRTYYIIAIEFSPENVAFELTIEHFEDEFIIIPPTVTITGYNRRGYCTVKNFESSYCVCKKVKCRIK